MSLWTCRRGQSQPRVRGLEDRSSICLEVKGARDRLSNSNMLTFREIMTDERFKSDSRVALKKPDFFFGDAIAEDDRIV